MTISLASAPAKSASPRRPTRVLTAAGNVAAILLWHSAAVAAVALAAPRIFDLSYYSGHLWYFDSSQWWEYLAPVGLATVALEWALAYIVFGLLGPRRPARRVGFLAAWRRACVVCAPLAVSLPVGLAWLADVPVLSEPARFHSQILLALGLGIPILLAPTIVARRAAARPVRRSRWRPVCPECGYSIRRLTSDRCPECGTAMPTTRRVQLRWAVRRLTWERRTRGSLLFAYLKTLAAILICPCRAARGLPIPDRYGRPIRWAVGHLLVFGLLACLFGSGSYHLEGLSFALVRGFNPGVAEWVLPPSPGPPLIYRIVWPVETLLVGMIAAGVLPAVGIVLGIAVPGRHRAARRAIARWSLYTTVILIPATVLYMAYAAQRSRVFFAGDLPFTTATPALVLLAVPYALWWARGVASNPYLRYRGWEVFVSNAALFIAVVCLIRYALFNPGAFRELL